MSDRAFVRVLRSRHLGAWCALLLLVASPIWGADTLLPSSPDSYLSQAARVRQSHDRPWAPEAGRLGNLRHLQITARDCVVRVVSGSENRVFPGTRNVVVVEGSRVLDAKPDEQPAPRDVVLASDRDPACPSVGRCGESITTATAAPRIGATGKVCFTVQIATAHDLLLGGDGLTVLIDRLQQPALRIAVNPSARLRLWLEEVDLGLLSIRANAPVRVGGNGAADFLQLDSSNGASVMHMHGLDARHIGVSTTTTGAQWSIRIGANTRAGYYQPARAGGALAKNYPIEIDGAVERLDMPAGRVDPQPIRAATREAARSLRNEVLASAGPAAELPKAEPGLPMATSVAAALPRDARERVAHIVARYLPASVRITEVALWKQGGRLEGIAPDPTTARNVSRLLTESGEFSHVSGGGAVARDGGHAFSVQMHFPCNSPGEFSTCPPGDPAANGGYSTAQVRETLLSLLGPNVSLLDLQRDGNRYNFTAGAPNVAAARAALDVIGKGSPLFRLSISGHGPSRQGTGAELRGALVLTCAMPPKPEGICVARTRTSR